MHATISINNDTLSKEELEELARKCQLTRIGKRLKAIVLILEGKLSRLQIGQKLKVGVQTLCGWVNCYNADGLSGLYDRPRTGRPSKLTEVQQQAVVGWVIEGTLDGEPDWTLESLQLKIKKGFGVSFSLEAFVVCCSDMVCATLHRDNITARLTSRHSSSSAMPLASRQRSFFQMVLTRNVYGYFSR